ncbi:Gfo/Idh/MocA family protein [Rhodoluna lacicola]|uniref:Putative dehydrogenase n=1 Tax=Rhodoluna lacicola TaxID=529884 RepID=A0A060JEB9_9MICO|nr:Gfo/Idh/MocA family oxidoreductase [Rhodoluna lacicola]AIC46932.1 putative dehydrogenase [Rhodoluna lacicola]
MKKATMRAGILGGGFMAEVHSRAIRAAGHEVVMISSSSPEKSAEAARRLGIEHIALDNRSLIESELVDVVHVCTPNFLHKTQTEQVINYGKPVICEKPLATTFADAQSLFDLSVATSIPTGVPFVYRYYPAVQEIRDRISRGDNGELHLLHGAYLQDWLAKPSSTNWRIDRQVGGESRTFADIGVHWCDLMEFVTGHRITKLVSSLATIHPERGSTEDAASILFETDRGAFGTLLASQISHGRKNELKFSFDGEFESYQWNQERPGRFSASNSQTEIIIEVGSNSMNSVAAQNLAYLPAGHPQGYQDAFNAFMKDCYRSFAGESVDGLPTFEDGLRAAQITEAVLQSSDSRQWVEVATLASAKASL